MILLDTNIIIGYFQGVVDIVAWLDRQLRKHRLAVSVITITELFAFKYFTEKDEPIMKLFVEQLAIVDIDRAIAFRAALLRRHHNLSTTDSLIAATAELLSIPIATRDKAFPRIHDIQVLVP